jgi:pectate lyase
MVLSLALAQQALGHACTLTSSDFDPELASAPRGCASEPCGEPASDAPMTSGSDGALEGDPASTPRVPETVGGPIGIDDPEENDPGTSTGGGTPAAADAGGIAPEPPEPAPSVLIGWASAPGLGLSTTTGGGTSEPVLADSAEALLDLAARPEPLVIAVAGTFDVPLLEIASNKTLIGAAGGATLRGGVRVRGTADAFVSNVIVQNIEIDAATSDAEGDAIQIHYAHHVWIDHCAIRDAADGLIDIVHGSDFVTLSFNRLFYTAAAPEPDHRFANLIGHSANNAVEDAGHLNVTLHHNFFGGGVAEATSARFGKIHVLNNYFASPGNDKVLSAGLSSSVLLENNYFEQVANPHEVVADSSATLLARGNVYVETSGAQASTGSAFAPDYPYQLGPVDQLPALLSSSAGPR